jgi:hypothetical protein
MGGAAFRAASSIALPARARSLDHVHWDVGAQPRRDRVVPQAVDRPALEPPAPCGAPAGSGRAARLTGSRARSSSTAATSARSGDAALFAALVAHPQGRAVRRVRVPTLRYARRCVRRGHSSSRKDARTREGVAGHP